ncbi:hypothetical protein FRC00_003923 [Tulasnella sp. 408]|nr:hypothetical protein FRC00_003923 [Tulasnella sp. 408]
MNEGQRKADSQNSKYIFLPCVTLANCPLVVVLSPSAGHDLIQNVHATIIITFATSYEDTGKGTGCLNAVTVRPRLDERSEMNVWHARVQYADRIEVWDSPSSLARRRVANWRLKQFEDLETKMEASKRAFVDEKPEFDASREGCVFLGFVEKVLQAGIEETAWIC